MPLTPADHARRRKLLNASEIAAVVGLHPFLTAAEVWASKVHDVTPWEGNDSTRAGDVWEPHLLDAAEKRLGLPVRRNVAVDLRIFGATLDGLVYTRSYEPGVEGVEAKHTKNDDRWGDPGTDEVPDHIFVQCQAQCLAGLLLRVHVVVHFGHTDAIRFYLVERSGEFIEQLIIRGTRFWEDHVLAKVPPPDQVVPLEVSQRVKAQPVACHVPASLVEAYEAAAAAESLAKKNKRFIQSLLAQHMGEAEVGFYGDEGKCVSFREQHRAAYTVEASTSRVMRTQKIKDEWRELPVVDTQAVPVVEGAA